MRQSLTRHLIHLLLAVLVPLAVLSLLVAPALAEVLGSSEIAAQGQPAAPSAGDESAANDAAGAVASRAADGDPASSDAAVASHEYAPEQGQATSAPAVRAPAQASSFDFNIN